MRRDRDGLRETALMATDAAKLLAMSQAQLDKLFSDGGSHRVPVGDADGTAIVLPGRKLSTVLARLIRLVAWQGKVFDADGNELANKVSPFRIRLIRAAVYKGTSRLDGNECIVLDYSRTSLVARWIRDEIREIEPGRYLGIVYWGKRRVANFFLVFGN